MKRFLPALAFASCLGLATSAFASVTYSFQSSPLDFEVESVRVLDFNPFGTSFTYTTSSFITTDTTVSGDAANCSMFIFSCSSVEFNPTAKGDVITINYDFGGIFGVARFTPFDFPGGSGDTYTFESGSFGKAGSYTSDNFAHLDVTVSAVPLPASAPMFGAALLSLAGLGYAAKRKKAATTA